MIRYTGTDSADALRFMRGPGDLWQDTSTTPPTLRMLRSANPALWARLAHAATVPALQPPPLDLPPRPPAAPDSAALMPTYINSFLLPPLGQAMVSIVNRTNDLTDAVARLIALLRDGGMAD